jgi:hydroxyacylglutathione hydrolase
MLLKRFYDDGLAQASYLLGCARTGEALVVDPNRDVAQYIAAAEAEGMRVTHVTETHIHADFVSGSRELARRTGAQLLLSAEGGAEWQYAFAADAGATLLRDGDRFMVGNVQLDVLHTPGHTPEHLAFVVTDTAGATEPMGVLTGDFVFVGDVGRPDLLERAAHYANTMEASARTLYRSLQRVRSLPDWLQVWPAHGAGSACGKALGAVPSSTVGYEKRFNWGLAEQSEDAFVTAVLAGQPEPPLYFAEMKRINREGPRLLLGTARPPRIPGEDLAAFVLADVPVVDTRHAADFASGYVPGTINIPLNRSFSTWAGWLLPYDQDFYLLVDDRDPATLDHAIRELAMIGLDRVAGYFGVDVIAQRQSAGVGLETVPQMTAEQLAAHLRRGDVSVVDVRAASEFAFGHIAGATHIPLGHLRQRLRELPPLRPLVLHCQGGGRSAIAASVLRAAGVTGVVNLTGGYAAWSAGAHDAALAAPGH